MKNYVLHLENELDDELINSVLKWHDTVVPDYKKLQSYYDGEHDIVNRVKDIHKPNNKLVNNFPAYIVDVVTGYTLGKAVSYTSDDESMIEDIQEILDANDSSYIDNLLCSTACIKKQAYELHYLNEDGELRIAMEHPENVVMVYDTKIEPEVRFAIRRSKQDSIDGVEPVEIIEVYDVEFIRVYENNNNQLKLIEERPHFMGEVPVIEYKANEERMGTFEKVLSLIDAYNKSQSDTINDIEYFADCYMYLTGMLGTKSEDIRGMKENKVLLLNEAGEAGFLTKDSNHAGIEAFKTRVMDDIYRFSMVPNISDESFGSTASGISLKFKMWSLEQIASKIERNFVKGFAKRFRLIARYLNLKQNKILDTSSIDVQFIRNMPHDVKSEAETLEKLLGRVSDQTAFAVTSLVDDPLAEIDRVRKQREDRDMYGESLELDEEIGIEVEG